MNLTKILPRANKPILVLAILAVTSPVWAQSPTYRPPPPPTQGTKLEVRLRYLFAPNIGFSGFGSVPLLTNINEQNNLFLNTQRYIQYDDGFLAQDYIQTTKIRNSLLNQELDPSANNDATAYFSYDNASQLNDTTNPTALTFHRYYSESDPNQVLDGSSSGSLGWEISYTKYINRKHNLGIMVGFSFNGFDSRFNSSIQSDLHTLVYRHDMANGDTVPALPEAGSDGSQQPYTGDGIRLADEDPPLLSWDTTPTEESEIITINGADISARADMRSSVYNLRAGPTYNLALGQTFGFELGAGLTAIYFNGRFSAYETLALPESTDVLSLGFETTNSEQLQLGGYLDANAYFNLTDRVSMFSGMQFQSGSTYTQENESRRASVDFSTQVFVNAGFGIKF